MEIVDILRCMIGITGMLSLFFVEKESRDFSNPADFG